MNLSKYFPYLVVVALVVVILLWLKSCQVNNENIVGLKSYNEMQADSLKIYKTKEGTWASDKKAADITQDNYEGLLKENADLKKQVKDFKKVNAVINAKNETKIDTVKLVFRDSIPCDFGSRDFVVDSAWYSISGKVTNKYVLLDEILITDNQAIVIGDLRQGLFKRSEYSVKVTHTNPYIQTTGLSAITIKPKKHWYDNKLIWLGFGMFTGGYIVLSATK
jgi:hypothetical protein